MLCKSELARIDDRPFRALLRIYCRTVVKQKNSQQYSMLLTKAGANGKPR